MEDCPDHLQLQLPLYEEPEVQCQTPDRYLPVLPSAAPSPPDAEAVIPQRILIERTSLNSALEEIPSAKAWIMPKIARDFVTEPKPTTAQLLISGARDSFAAFSDCLLIRLLIC